MHTVLYFTTINLETYNTFCGIIPQKAPMQLKHNIFIKGRYQQTNPTGDPQPFPNRNIISDF